MLRHPWLHDRQPAPICMCVPAEGESWGLCRWAQWRQLTTVLGLSEESTALVLNAQSRALLIFLQVPARAGSSHVILQACAPSLFSWLCCWCECSVFCSWVPLVVCPNFAKCAHAPVCYKLK